MKTQLFLLFICAASLFEMQAQVFPESDAIWNIQAPSGAQHYGLSGDTIIDDKLYSKLYQLNDTTLIIDATDRYIGGFRTEGKKVWFRPDLSYRHEHYGNTEDPHPEETILYDFSKNVGDTIWHNIIYQGSWYMEENITASIVYDIIDSEDGKIYKTAQYINNSYNGFVDLHPMMGQNDSWVEGVGSLNSGLFWFLYYPSMGGGSPYRLACFKQGYEVKYMDNPWCNVCFCWTAGLQDNTSIPMKIAFENNSLFIKGEPSLFPCELQLFSPMGQLILEKKLQSSKEEIPVNQLQGIYLYQVQKNKEIVKTGKIIFN